MSIKVKGFCFMEENIIIKSEQYKVKKLFRALIAIGAIFLLIVLIYEISDLCRRYDVYKEHTHSSYCYDTEYIYDYQYSYETGYIEKSIKDSFEKLNCAYMNPPRFNSLEFFVVGFCPFVLLALLAFLIKFWLSSYEMVVTDKRIYGKVAWGKRVDLPFDSISATATLRAFKGVAVSSASGKIKFLLIKNANEMYTEINKLLIERQKKEAPAVTEEKKTDTPDDLIKLKELLDMNIISQEEFDAKKKQILGL